MKETTLGEYLKTKIEATGRTQLELSTKLGYQSGQFLSNWTRDVSVPPAKVIAPLAKELGVTTEELGSKVVERIVSSFAAKTKNTYGV
jgi:transcriptional regulator with XRE-family HTH domain